MPSSIQNFIAYLNQYNDTARVNRFRVLVTVPPLLLQNGYAGMQEKLSMQCEMIDLPGRYLQVFEQRTYGLNVKFPYQTQYQEITPMFFCMNGNGSTGGLNEKAFFEDWMELINPNTNESFQYSMEYKDNYSSKLTFEHYDLEDNLSYSIDILEAFPIAISPIMFTWQDDNLVKLMITIAYTRWERKDIGLHTPQLNISQMDTLNPILPQSVPNPIGQNPVGQTFTSTQDSGTSDDEDVSLSSIDEGDD